MSIKQSPFSTTLISSVKYAYEHFYGSELSDEMFFGLTGHCFVTAISRTIGPCAPYTWDMSMFRELVDSNLGLSIMEHEHAINPKDSDEKKKEASDLIKNYLNDGYLVFVNSYEFQVIFKYTDTHFITTKPWDAESVTNDIEIETLKGIKDFLLFSKIEKTSKIASFEEMINKSIHMAIAQYGDFKTMDFITQGIKAYDYMLEQLNEDSVNGHGMWWVSTVWKENRAYASLYLDKLRDYKDTNILDNLITIYDRSAEIFGLLSNKSKSVEETKKLIIELKSNEEKALPLLNGLLAK